MNAFERFETMQFDNSDSDSQEIKPNVFIPTDEVPEDQQSMYLSVLYILYNLIKSIKLHLSTTW